MFSHWSSNVQPLEFLDRRKRDPTPVSVALEADAIQLGHRDGHIVSKVNKAIDVVNIKVKNS